MTQQSKAQGMSGRALALARRKALSSAGKSAVTSSAPSRTGSDSVSSSPKAAASAPTQSELRAGASAPVSAALSTPRAAPRRPMAARSESTSRAAALARRKAMSSKGKVAAGNKDRTRDGVRGKTTAEATIAKTERKNDGCSCGCKENGERRDITPVQAVPANAAPGRSNGRSKVRGPRRKDALINSGLNPGRAANPELSGRELAKALREQRSRRGGAGQKKSAPVGRSRAARSAPAQGAAQDAPWKVGASQTSYGQTVTGTMVGRSRDVTGDEASACRTVTGTEYMGADIFREFCQSEPAKAYKRVGVSPTSGGNRITGNEVGRSTKVTGDESGTCKNVTGTEYLGANLQEAFCGIRPERGPSKISTAETLGGKPVTGNNVGRSNKVTGDEVGSERTLTGTQYMQLGSPGSERGSAPPKVGASATLRGGAVTGTMVGRHKAMTGDEAGSCRNISGDDYIGQEQFGEFCASTPKPQDLKVGVSATLGGERVTGTMTGRAPRVTGDEPGTCKAITGTPYAGAEQYGEYCEPTQAGQAAARMEHSRRTFGLVMSGIQPGVGGKMTGDAKGACEPVTGTPYVGADQAAEACPATAAEPRSPDFPQPLPGAGPGVGTTESWGRFSVSPPAHAARAARAISGVTGSTGESGQITGPFGMAPGKVTGTEEARFGRGNGNRGEAPLFAQPPAEQAMLHGRVKSRITGEGIDAGTKITGDDWDRGDRVTGTEGTSALARNPSHRGPLMPMAAAMAKGRPEDVAEPVSKVTGGSGNTDKGALVTYSGGARG